jgi:hypothetical protein
VNPASVLEAQIFILRLLGGELTSKHWSCGYEHWLSSACVGAQTARLLCVVYKLHCYTVEVVFCSVGGSHKYVTS